MCGHSSEPAREFLSPCRVKAVAQDSSESARMAPVQPFQLVPIGPSGRAMADMVDATGTANFGAVLLNHLQEACGADYCAVFRIGADAPSEFVTGSYDGSLTAHSRVDQYLQRRYWSKDPAMTYVQTRLAGPAPMLMRRSSGPGLSSGGRSPWHAADGHRQSALTHRLRRQQLADHPADRVVLQQKAIVSER